mmetsp:Transcript_19844/g.56400  ORF Transcript_19844/g.56400 Transcript_19844/m.56400 type:complete len:209 (-) Transcript_19844:235-861(-)
MEGSSGRSATASCRGAGGVYRGSASCTMRSMHGLQNRRGIMRILGPVSVICASACQTMKYVASPPGAAGWAQRGHWRQARWSGQGQSASTRYWTRQLSTSSLVSRTSPAQANAKPPSEPGGAGRLCISCSWRQVRVDSASRSVRMRPPSNRTCSSLCPSPRSRVTVTSIGSISDRVISNSISGAPLAGSKSVRQQPAAFMASCSRVHV